MKLGTEQKLGTEAVDTIQVEVTVYLVIGTRQLYIEIVEPGLKELLRRTVLVQEPRTAFYPQFWIKRV